VDVKLIYRVLRTRDRLFRYPRCHHLSHALGLPCWHGTIYDGFCAEHNNTCYGGCGPMIKDHWFRADHTDEPCAYTDCGRPQDEHVESVGEWMGANHWFRPSWPLTCCMACDRHWRHSTHIGSRKNRQLYWKGWFFKLRERFGGDHLMCWHLSHRLKLPCFREMYSTHAMLCEKHYDSCHEGCP
jgi:hypothetical protein